MNWTADQQKIINARDCNLLVSAAAGSGKTAVLVERIIQMISDKENPVDIDELLVVTFTKAAAAQMRDKIGAELEKRLLAEPENEHYLRQMNGIPHANILTIDSFCYQVVKEHFHILGIDPAVRIGEPGEIGLLREEVLEQIIEERYREYPDFVEFSDAFAADKEDSRIEEYILKIYTVCSSYPRPEEWIRQAKYSVHVETEEQFLALPLVKQYFEELHSAAQGIRTRIGNALEQVRGIDGPGYMEKALLADIAMAEDIISAKNYSQFADIRERKFANIGRGKKGTYDEDAADRIKKLREDYKKEIGALLAVFAVPFDRVLSQFKQQEPMLFALLDSAEAFRTAFLQAKLKRGILEFSDVEHFALQILCDGYDKTGEPVPSAVGKEMSEGFQEILIDEYQDSNYLQEAILKCVSTVYQGRNNIFMVGDVKQSIYSFRMARPDLFMDKYHTYAKEEGADCRKLLLKNNFRSRGNILETVNYLFYQVMGSDLGGIEYTKEEALVPGKEFLDAGDDRVELLLGESKDFDFLNAGDEEMCSEKEEHLDENLEDIGKIELEASIVAGRIEKLLGRDGGVPFQVLAGDEKSLRPVRQKDIVILFRAPSVFQHIFAETLMSYNIPVKVQNENGYFDTVEISLILSLLRILDNPFLDVETTAVLRSYFGGFSNDELALLSVFRRCIEKEKGTKQCLYQIIKRLARFNTKKQAGENSKIESGVFDQTVTERILSEHLSEHKAFIMENMCPKCRNFLFLVEGWREKKAYTAIYQLLTDIYYESGYYFYVEAMPEGKARIRNLDLLLMEAKRFENGSFQSVFDFLRYVDKLQKKAISLGGDPAPESSEDVVRIMSIHKSKGLEFPVVFLSGIGKNFNLMDTKTPLIVHSDYYVGAKYVDTKKRCGNDTFARKAMAGLMITQSIAEELRIFYVGLTRAKEKLIMSGVTSDIPALIKRYEDTVRQEQAKLTYSVLHTARNYLDFVTAAFIRNREFHAAMGGVRRRMDKKGEHILSAEYDQPFILEKPDIRLKVEVYDYRSLLVRHVRSNMDIQQQRSDRLEVLRRAPAQSEQQIFERLAWKYGEPELTLQKSKLSVTEIKRIYETEYEPSDVVIHPISQRQDRKIPLPHFLAGKRHMEAAEKGTWMHKTMELLDHANVKSRQQVTDCLTAMRKEGRIPEEAAAFITQDKIYAFVSSPLGKRMQQAAAENRLYKEKQFVIGVPVSRLTGKESKKETGDSEEVPIVVQGIIDAYFKEEENLILVDYKTDWIKDGQEKILLERYKTQLLYYKETLEQLTGLEVSETYLYSFALDKEIRMF